MTRRMIMRLLFEIAIVEEADGRGSGREKSGAGSAQCSPSLRRNHNAERGIFRTRGTETEAGIRDVEMGQAIENVVDINERRQSSRGREQRLA
jgi:hypothetical protein